ncbi:MAG: peptidoglycan-binding domain-containing protein [Pseudomonadota bacterium]
MPTSIEEQKIALKALREQFDALHTEAMRDGEIDPETEQPLLDLVDGNIKKLEAAIAKAEKSKPKPRKQRKKDTAKDAWDAFAKSYKKLKRLHDRLYTEYHDGEADLRRYLEKIEDAVDDENWDEALAQGILAFSWAEEQGLLEDEEDDEDAPEDTSKAAWDKMAEMMQDFRDLHAFLVKEKMSGHARKIDKWIKSIDKAVADEDYKVAVRVFMIAGAYAEEHGLWDLLEKADEEEDGGDTGPVEDDNPARTAWEATEKHVMPVLRDAHADLVAAKSEFAPLLQVFLDNIAKMVDREEYEEAIRESVQASKWLDDNDLWDVKPEENDPMGDLWFDTHQGKMDDLDGLYRRLKRAKHEKADDLKAKIDAIEGAIAKKQWFPAQSLLGAALQFAHDEGLWEAAPPTHEDELEDIWWDANGENYKKIKLLVATLEAMDHEQAKDFREKVDRIQSHLDEGLMSAAAMLLDQLVETADDDKLWAVKPPKKDPSDEISAKHTWESLEKEWGEVQYLEVALQEMKHEKADDITAMVQKIIDAELAEDYEAAERHLAAVRATASGLGLWDLLDEEEDEDAEDEEETNDAEAEAKWEASKGPYDEMVELHNRLTDAMHPKSAEIGTFLTLIADAEADGHWQQALDNLKRAKEVADANDLWDFDPSPDSGIRGSVGKKGKNYAEDVIRVQMLLNQNGASLKVNGECGADTIAAIETFQKENLGFKDGRVDPNGRTWKALTGKAVVESVKKVAGAVADKAVDIAEEVADTAEDMWDSMVDFVTGEDDEEEEIQQ